MPDAVSPKVLIVDDDDDVRLGLRQMLEQLGEFDISEVADGQEALDAVMDTKFDLLLLDINLPRVSGGTILMLVGAGEGFQRPGHIAVMSAESNLGPIKTRPEAVYVDSYLSKPFRYEDLQQIVTTVTGVDDVDGLLT